MQAKPAMSLSPRFFAIPCMYQPLPSIRFLFKTGSIPFKSASSQEQRQNRLHATGGEDNPHPTRRQLRFGCGWPFAAPHHCLHAPPPVFGYFFFNDTATTEIYTLSLHDALPILKAGRNATRKAIVITRITTAVITIRSEEHTSELQSPDHLVCRLLLEKKKN